MYDIRYIINRVKIAEKLKNEEYKTFDEVWNDADFGHQLRFVGLYAICTDSNYDDAYYELRDFFKKENNIDDKIDDKKMFHSWGKDSVKELMWKQYGLE